MSTFDNQTQGRAKYGHNKQKLKPKRKEPQDKWESLKTLPFPLNTWNLVGFTYDGTTLTGYKNGVSFGSVVTDRQSPQLNAEVSKFISDTSNPLNTVSVS